MEKTWKDKDGRRWPGGSIVTGGRRVFNPTDEQLAGAGYVAEEPQPHIVTLEDAKARMRAAIEAYDTGEDVRGFVLDGVAGWLDRDTRGGVARRLASEEAAGRSVSTLWLGGRSFVLPIGRARAILDKVEIYAADCFDVTAAHKAAVESLESIAAVDAYDYTAGYPERLTLTTREEAGDE